MAVQLSFFVSSPFAVEAAEIYCRPGKNWYNTTRLRIELNGATLSDHDLCEPELLDSAGQRGMPRLVEQQVMARGRGQQNSLRWVLYGAAKMDGKNHQLAYVWDVNVSTADGGGALPLDFAVETVAATPKAHAAAFGKQNTDSPLQWTSGSYATWSQSDHNWARAKDRRLYKALLASARRNSPKGSLIFATHFGMQDWLPSHGGLANRIDPAHEYEMMMIDGTLADGIVIWWDQVGLGRQIADHTGAFAQPASPSAAFPLALAFPDGQTLYMGWFSRWSNPSLPVAAGVLRVRMRELATKPGAGLGFRKIIRVGNHTAFNATGGNCTEGQPLWTDRPCPNPTGQSGGGLGCTSTCRMVPSAGERAHAEWVEEAMIHVPHPMVGVELRLIAAVDEGHSFSVLWNSSLIPAGGEGWGFESGIDARVSSIVRVHERIVNATRTLLSCGCG